MGLEPVHQPVLGLANILDAAAFACYAVYHVGAFAGNIGFPHILPP